MSMRNEAVPEVARGLGLTGGLGTVADGVTQAYTGFSPLAMVVGMSASSALPPRAVAVGVSAAAPVHHVPDGSQRGIMSATTGVGSPAGVIPR